MSNYDTKLRKVFQSVESHSHYLLRHKKPLECVLFQDFKGVGRDYANMIHDIPSVWSGLASQSAIRNKLNNVKSKHSEDHFYSRQRGGEEIVTLILKTFGQGRSPTFEEVRAIIDKYCHVHYVTREENNILKHIMEPGMRWKQAYSQAGVLLVNAKELFGKRGRRSEEWKKQMQVQYKLFLKQKPIKKAGKK